MSLCERSFQEILESEIVDVVLLRKLSYTGIPAKYRLEVYKILLDVVGLETKSSIRMSEKMVERYYKYYHTSFNFGKSKINLGKTQTENGSLDKQESDGSNGRRKLSVKMIKPDNDKIFNLNQNESLDLKNDMIKPDNDKIFNLNQNESLDLKNDMIKPDNDKIFNLNQNESLEKNEKNSNIDGINLQMKNLNESKKREFFERNVSKKIEYQIYLDIERININYRVYYGYDVSFIYSNVLKMTAIKRPFIGYTQGMADLLMPFVHLLFSGMPITEESIVTAEATVYFCFSSLLGRIQHNIFDMQESLVERLENVMRVIDIDIVKAFENIGLRFKMISIRWFGCLFIREFEIDVWFRLFDAMLCDNIDDFLVFFASALLLWFKPQITSGDFSETITFIQEIPEISLGLDSMELLIGSANFIKSDYFNKSC